MVLRNAWCRGFCLDFDDELGENDRWILKQISFVFLKVQNECNSPAVNNERIKLKKTEGESGGGVPRILKCGKETNLYN